MSSGGKTPLRVFREQATALVDYIISIWPEDREFQVIGRKLELGFETNPRLVLNVFLDSLAPYIDPLFKNDMDFFLGQEYSEVDAEYMKLIPKLKECWTSLGDRPKLQKNIQMRFKAALIRGVLADPARPHLLEQINTFFPEDKKLSYA